MLWACITLPHLALDTLLRRRPPEDTAPLVVIDGPLQARRVLDANDGARAAGIHPGQPLTTAHALLARFDRSEEHTSELQSHVKLVCRLLLEKKKPISQCEHSRNRGPG